MSGRVPMEDTSDHDAVMSWLQDRELKDHRLADARSGIGGRALIATAIARLQEKAYLAFPRMDRAVIDGFVQAYVDPSGQTAGSRRQESQG